ncbi:cardiolipin synthetase 2 [Tumebacillus sp. BK434]|uniref:cardiolipin synthase n=1 Tax=Tumebacillus sp. BK434 TaxID=2512169 RepID=UPI0010E02FE0|nr:cardiolipin synthase [Tumebacillus sp. BK434]TCP55715.1 cardiolipin synthetase 2 [Tumebacillus sp. BK434]
MHILEGQRIARVVKTIFWMILLCIGLLQVLFIGTVIILENRNPGKTVAWLIVLTLLPILGFLIYLAGGRNARQEKLFRHKHMAGGRLESIVDKQLRQLSEDHVLFGYGVEQKKRLVRLSLQNSLSPLTSNNSFEVLTDGKLKFQVLFEELEKAQDHIHLMYYIFRDDQIGRDTQQLLLRKKRQGVEVRVMVDGLGSHKTSKRFFQEMRDAGIDVAVFFPVRFPFLSSRLNFRNHRKIVVVDGQVGLLGGMNIGDEYLSRDPKLGFWRDTHLLVRGDSVQLMQKTFLNDWYFVTRQKITADKYYPQPEPVGNMLVQIVPSGPDAEFDSIRQMFFTACATAEKRIYLQTAYFIPDDSLIMALKMAALSGVDVRLLLQGVSEYQVTYWASRSYFSELLEAGVKIYQYQKGILHTKVLIIDDEVASLGSANFDIRSFLLNFEIGAFLYNKEFAERLERDFQQDLQDSVRVDREVYKKRPLKDKLRESGARLLSPLL